MPWWLWLAVGWLIAASGFLFLWGLGVIRATDRRRVGDIDLTVAAARGELDLDWSDPRERVGGFMIPVDYHEDLPAEFLPTIGGK